jgi:muramoyltetrapeptide carboxypeptidase
MVKPKALHAGDTLAVIAPSSGMPAAELEPGLALLHEWGFETRVYPSAYASRGYLAGIDDAGRVADFVAAFTDPSIAGIVCARGGYGATRLLHRINWQQIAEHPKFFVGFSDITSLHLALARLGHVTFHGPMVAAGIDRSAYNANLLRQAMTSLRPLGDIPLPDDGPLLRSVVDGVARGRLVGGNLSLIAATLGTPWEIDTRGKIVLIEDVDEAPYRVDRMLVQLLQAGKLRDARGILFGDSPTCEKGPAGKPSLTLFEVFDDLLVPLRLPLLYGFPCGHSAYRATLPLGVEVELDAGTGTLKVLEAATEQ